MDRIEPTRAHALKILWAFLWRSALGAVIVGFAIGLVFGLVKTLLGMSSDVLNVLNTIAGFCLGLAVSLEVMYRVLRKKFGDFEIALVPRQDQRL